MELYFGAYSANKATMVKTEIYIGSLIVIADNRDEAIGKMLQMVYDELPSADGWCNYYIPTCNTIPANLLAAVGYSRQAAESGGQDEQEQD